MGQGAFQWTEKFDPFWQEVFWCAIAFLGVLVATPRFLSAAFVTRCPKLTQAIPLAGDWRPNGLFEAQTGVGTG
eukprot:782-Rhodomonas_salina.1